MCSFYVLVYNRKSQYKMYTLIFNNYFSRYCCQIACFLLVDKIVGGQIVDVCYLY